MSEQVRVGSPEASSMWRVALRLLAAALIIAAIAWASGPESLWKATRIGPMPALQVLAATAALSIFSSLRWRLVLQRLEPGEVFPALSVLRVVVAGLALGLVVSQDVGSASSRMAYLSRGRRISIGRAGYSVLLDRWLDLVLLACLVVPSALFLSGLTSAFVALPLMAAAVAGLFVLGLLWPSSIVWLLCAAFGAIASLLGRLRKRPITVPSASEAADALGTRAMALALLLSFLRLGAVTVRAWVVAAALGLDISLVEMLLVVPVVQVALLVPFTPGGLGVYDAGWYGALLSQGVAGADALAFVVLHRVISTAALLAIFALTELGWHLSRASHRPLAGTTSERR